MGFFGGRGVGPGHNKRRLHFGEDFDHILDIKVLILRNALPYSEVLCSLSTFWL